MRDLAVRMGSLSKLTITVALAALMGACGGGGDSGLDGRESPTSVDSFAPQGARSCFPPPHGLTGWWPGDGNTDDIVGGRDAMLRGNATTGAGLVDKAFILDGDGDFVQVPHDPALNFGTNDFTVALWVYFNNTDGEQVLVEKWVQRYPGSVGWTLTKLENNALLLAMATGDGNEASVESNALSIPTATWIHFAATRNGTHVALFMNGVPIAAGVVPPTNVDSDSSLKFGHRGNPDDTPGSEDTGGFYLNGRIDEVEVFVGQALPRGLIRAIFNAGSAGECKKAAGEPCKAANAGTGVQYKEITNPLGTAIAEASSGDTIQIWGVCVGNFAVDKNLTLQGQGNKATLDGGNNNGTVLRVQYPVAANLTVKDLTIVGGGSGITSYDGVLTVIRTHVSGNAGTGIANWNAATVVVEDSVISGNTGVCGGGLYNSLATMTIRNSLVSGNTATGSRGCSAPGNAAAGGGIYTRGGLIVENSRVVGNLAINGFGGGIFNNSTLILTGSTVSGNAAQSGGGIYNYYSYSTVTLDDSIVSGNIPDDIAP